MDQPGAPEFILEAFADPNSVREVVRGILHTIFFLRFFPTILPQTRDVLGLELAYVPDAEIETLIDQRVDALVRQLELERHQSHNPSSERGLGLGLGLTGTPPPPGSGSGNSGWGSRGQITVQFLEKRRRKTWYAMRGDDEVCWESWTVKVAVADPRTEAERAKVRRASETTLRNAIFKASTLANEHKDHIPPITTTESNPFPYQIHIGGGGGGHPHRSRSPLQQPQQQQHHHRSSSSGGGGGGSSSSNSSGPAQVATTISPAAGAARRGLVGTVGGSTGAAVTGWATRMGIY
ncbi:104783cb-c584-449a-8746-c38bad85011b [Thermothielavioides terrestris]|uniref:Autophagy-related protein 101 n=2 Tax=Thermothielavioides terrestris TaxID=2587410 RepID=G2RAV9_THETT|nr:uncharacterized protein THITE_2118776 [Thermothielavioides terrestris NRRL 8126]AEO68934.1 hypothetical protein THITE_2118776 [Thermothielavioides terrestris NRRL 8126]SPQ22795.1 104783cb-c584-449a-8746-c38bad85011b [Thermothielavioides terrestris]